MVGNPSFEPFGNGFEGQDFGAQAGTPNFICKMCDPRLGKFRVGEEQMLHCGSRNKTC